MSAKHQLATSEDLLPSVDYPAPSANPARHDLQLVVAAREPAPEPEPVAVPVDSEDKPNDPLADLKSLSEEEIVALFS